MAAIFNESSQSELGLLNSTTVTPVDIEQQVDMASADTEQPSVQQTSRQDTSPPPDNAFCDMQDMLSPMQDYQPVRLSGEQQDVHMYPPPDNALKDVVSDNPPELSAGPSGEQSVRQPEPTVVASAPQHKGSLKYINKYLVQYAPVKQKKPSSSSRVTGARILTSEECAQIIFDCEEKRRKEIEEKEARRVAKSREKRRKKKQLGKK